MTDLTFTILMPVVRTPELIGFAIDSVLHQTRGDFELLVVGDGAPPETIQAAERISIHDGRVRVFPFPKGERHGEAHRHTVLQSARGRYVCGLADDDIWFPEHLEEVAALLCEFEFGNILHANIKADGVPFVALTDLADPRIQARMVSEIYNFFAPSQAAYRRETYDRLPVGWSPAPDGVPTDLAMWRKFLALPDLAAGTRFVLTSLHFPAAQRGDWPLEQRAKEIAGYAERAATAQGRDHLRQLALGELAHEYVGRHDYILSLLKHAEWLKEQLAREKAAAESASAAWQEETLALRQRNESIARELEAVRASWPWRIAAPVRRLARLVRGDG